MKVSLMIMALLGLAFAQDTTQGYAAQWTGSLVGGPLFRGVSFNTGSCIVDATSPIPYQVANVSVPTTFPAGVREVQLLVDAASFTTAPQVLLYSPFFDPTNPCTNIVRPATGFLQNANQNGFSGSYVIDDPVYFKPNLTYAIVVTTAGGYSIPTGTSGAFGLAILTSVGFASSSTPTIANQTWVPSYVAAAGCTLIPGAPLQNFDVIKWVQPGVTGNGAYLITGITDLNGTFVGSDDMYWSVYLGGFGVADYHSNACSGTVASSIRKNQQAPARIAPLVPVLLTTNTQYSMPISAPFLSAFGATVIPAPVAAVPNNPQNYPATPVTLHPNGWIQPSRTLPCAASTTATNTSWAVLPSFTALGHYVLVNTNPGNLFFSYYNYTTFASYAFVYQGSLATTPTTAPAACPAGLTLVAFGSADASPLVVTTTPGQSYTVVLSQSVATTPINPTTGAVAFAVMSGGPLTPSGTTTGLTGGSTTHNASTSTSTTASASSLTISTLFVLACIASLLF